MEQVKLTFYAATDYDFCVIRNEDMFDFMLDFETHCTDSGVLIEFANNDFLFY